MGLKARAKKTHAVGGGWRVERVPFTRSAALIDAVIEASTDPLVAEPGDLVRLRPAAHCSAGAQAVAEFLLRTCDVGAVSVAPEAPGDAVFASGARPDARADVTAREAVEELLAAAADPPLTEYVRTCLDAAGL